MTEVMFARQSRIAIFSLVTHNLVPRDRGALLRSLVAAVGRTGFRAGLFSGIEDDVYLHDLGRSPKIRQRMRERERDLLCKKSLARTGKRFPYAFYRPY